MCLGGFFLGPSCVVLCLRVIRNLETDQPLLHQQLRVCKLQWGRDRIGIVVCLVQIDDWVDGLTALLKNLTTGGGIVLLLGTGIGQQDVVRNGT